MIEIDGSHGEGGGQIIRSALALSAVTGKPFSIRQIRAGRKKTGLLRQHLTAVQAAREICEAGVTGAELHSDRLTFAPGAIQTRDFHFRVGTAGSATLVAQTVLPALMLANGASRLEIEGGTHNMAAPPFDYLTGVFLPLVERMGPKFVSRIDSYGFYPVGGGRFKLDISPCGKLAPLEILERGGNIVPLVTALVSKLPQHIGQRECDVIRRKSNWRSGCFSVREITNSPGPGNVVMIRLSSPQVTEMFTGFGKRGIRAEDVARDAYRQAKTYIENSAPVGEHLADQLMMPMGLAAAQGQTCRFRTGALSMHSKTHIDVLQMFLDIAVQIKNENDLNHEISFSPRGT